MASAEIEQSQQPFVENQWLIFRARLLEQRFSEESIEGIQDSYDMGQGSHYGELRKSGQEWAFSHPEGVAYFLIDAGVKNPVIIKASLLHDKVEDTHFVIKEGKTNSQVRAAAERRLRNRFGAPTAKLVMAVTNVGPDRVEIATEEEALEESHRILIKGGPEAVLLKLGDRVHYFKDLYEGINIEKLKEKIKETEEFLIPLSHSMGSSYRKSRRILEELLQTEIAIVKKKFKLA